MITYLANRLNGWMGTRQAQTPISANNPIPEPQHLREELDTTDRMTISGQPRTESIWSTSTSIRRVASAEENIPQPMVGWPFEQDNRPLDWNLAFQTNTFVNPVNLVKWIVIVPEEYGHSIDNSIRNMMLGSQPNKYQMLAFQIVKLKDILIPNYLQNIDNAQQDGKDFQMLFVILPQTKIDLYLTVEECLRSFDFPSVCMFANNANPKNLLLMAKEETNQMREKFGIGIKAREWSNKVSVENLMVVGFDIYQAKGSSISTGSMVCKVDNSYFSITSSHWSEEELCINFKINIKKCCNAYKFKKGFLPDRILIFRGGVEVEQIGYIKTLELPQILNELRNFYGVEGKQIPKLSYILVVKNANSHMISEIEKRPDTFPPGTVVDSNITLSLRYHFFLNSQATQERAKPTSFFVLYDTQGLTSQETQTMTYKLSHVCFDWSGLGVVPAPCLFAYRLAFLVGISRGKHANHFPAQNMTFL